MESYARKRLKLKQDRTRREWYNLYNLCKHGRLKERYHAMFLSFDYEWKEISKILGKRYDTILGWVHAYNKHGLKGLEPLKAPGYPPKLTKKQLAEVKQAVIEGPRSLGLSFSNWDTKTLGLWIKDRYGRKFSREGIRKLLRRLGFRYKKPGYAYINADKEEQQAFVQQLKQRVRLLNTDEMLLFLDECTARQHPTLKGMWILKGIKHVIKTFGNHARRNISAAVNPLTGDLFHRASKKLRAVDFIAFLKQLLSSTSKKLVLVIDRAQCHKANVTREFLAEHTDRIEVIWLPKASPKLNPAEHLWKEMKHAVTHNWFFRKIGSMVYAIKRFLNGFGRDDIMRICSMDYLVGKL